MTYDLCASYRRPWDLPPAPASKTSMSSCLYSTRAPPPPSSSSGRRVQRPGAAAASSSLSSYSSSVSSWAPDQNTEALGVRSQEREQLVGLNDRFASYIETVRRLEQQNRALLAQLGAAAAAAAAPPRLRALYEGEARGLRAAADAESCERARAAEERERLRGVYEELRERCHDEERRRREAQEEAQRAREEAGRAALAGARAAAGLASLAGELGFLREVFAREQEELRAELEEARRAEEEEEETRGAGPDLSSALGDIRGQYERLALRGRRAAEEWYRGKVAAVAAAAGRQAEAVHAAREETLQYRRMLQGRSAEVEGLRTAVDSLTRRAEEQEETQGGEVEKYQMRIGELEADISDAKQEMSRYLREYQDLLNVKMALDIEITAYRKLLEGEEFRLAYPAPPGLA